jgi:arginyl-tRNA synthetase
VAHALQLGHIPFDIILYQLVTMKQGGAIVQMSKRTGSMITLDDVMDEVGVDVARFFYLHRKADAQLEFDLDLAMKKTEDNPVYYLQYAYVRIKSIQAKAHSLNPIDAHDAYFITRAEVPLIKKMIAFKSLLVTIGTTHQTHLLTYYTLELADIFHKYYAHERVISEDSNLSKGRLLLMNTLEHIFSMSFDFMGISKPERM